MKLLGMGTTPTNITTNPPALAVNTYPTEANSFELHGKSLVSNQQIYQIYNTIDPSLTGLTVTFNNGVLSVSGTADVTLNIKLLDNNDLVANHIYYFNAPTGASTSGYRPYFATSGDSYTADSVITWTTGKGSFNIRVNGGTSTDFSYYPQFIDLTQMFGPGFEPTTVNQLKSVIDLDKYIPYNPGTFIHNNSTYEVNKWNQLMQPNGYLSRTSTGITYVNNNDGTVTMSGTATGTDNITYINIASYWIAGHKYLIGTSSKYSNKLSGNNISQNFTGATLFTYSSSPIYVGINVVNGTSYSDTWSVNFVDLTDIFGAGKEPTTVDECKLRFLSMGIDITKYQPYSPLGSNLGGNTFNLWDGTGIDGQAMGNSGGTYASSSNFATYYIAVSPSTKYYLNSTNWESWANLYNSSFTFTGQTSRGSDGGFTTGSATAYVRLTGKLSQKATACFNIYQPDTSISPHNGDYEPYRPQVDKVDLGFNIWDEECELGTIEQNGTMASSTTAIRTKNYIPASAQTGYYINTGKWRDIHCYDSSFQHLGTAPYSASGPGYTFTTLTGTAYLKVPFTTSYGTTYNHDICINLSQSDTTKSPHNGDYRPYLMLRGIGSDFNKLDLNREQGTLSGQSSSTKRQFEENKYYVGLAYDNNFKSNEIDGYSISSSQISVNAKDGYGVAFPIRCLPNTTYYSYRASVTNYGSIYIAFYTQDGTWISGTSTNYANTTVTSPSTAYWIVPIYGGGGTSFSTRVFTQPCINLSQPQTTINPHNGQYVPHLFDTYDSMSGILTRRIGAVDLGTLNFVYDSTYAYWEVAITGFALPPNIDTKGNISHPIYENRVTAGFSATGNNGITLVMTGYLRVKTTSSSVRPSGILLYEINAYQVFTPIQYSVVDLGSLSWVYDSTYSNFYTTGLNTTIKRPAASNIIPNVRCSKYSAAAQDNYSTNNTIKVITNGQVWIKDTSYGTDASAFKTGVTGVMLTYQNNTPYKFGIVDMGTLSWTYISAYKEFTAVPPNMKPVANASTDIGNVTCEGYTPTRLGYMSDHLNDDMLIAVNDSTSNILRVRNLSYTDATTFKNAVKGKILTYELSDSVSQTTITQPISFVSGKLGKQYGVVDLGKMNWSIDGIRFYNTVLPLNLWTNGYAVCGRYKRSENNVVQDKSWGKSGAGYFEIYDSFFTDAIAFKNSLQGQYLIYKLSDSAANPTYATAGNLIRKTNGNVGDVDFNLKYWEESQVKLIKVGNKFLAVSE